MNDHRTKRASLRDVAKLAGVSIATASRVLSGADHPVTEETRLAVVSAAERLSFQPNRLARALVTSRSGVVGAIVHDISDPYFGDIVRGLEDGLGHDDYRIVVASSDRNPRKELEYLNALIGQQVDGVVLAASSLADRSYENEMVETVARYRKQGGSVVLLSEHVVQGPRVVFDNVGATRDMVTHLARAGHRRIAYLAGPDNLVVAKTRLDGYRQGLEAAGIAYDDSLVGDGGFSIDEGSAAVLRLLEANEFTALFAANDLMAIGATRALLDRGIRIPEDISVAGFDDIILAEYGPVRLTTVRMPTHEMGLKGAELLLALLRGEDPADMRAEGSIVERDSVARLPQHDAHG